MTRDPWGVLVGFFSFLVLLSISIWMAIALLDGSLLAPWWIGGEWMVNDNPAAQYWPFAVFGLVFGLAGTVFWSRRLLDVLTDKTLYFADQADDASEVTPAPS